jgi:hypothetical protein
MALRATLDTDLPRQVLAPIRRTGQDQAGIVPVGRFQARLRGMTSPSLEDRLKTYLPLAAATASALYIAARLFAVAMFDPETAYGILQSTGTATTIIGTLVSLIGPATTIGALTSIVVLRNLPRNEGNDNTSLRSFLLAMSIILGVVGVLMTPLLSLIAAALLFLYISRTKYKSRVISILIGAATGFLLTTLFQPPWWPSERLDLKGSRPITVYVLYTEPQRLTILVAKPRKIERIDSNTITRRSLCVPKQSFSDYILFTPLPAVIANQRSNYPQCPP